MALTETDLDDIKQLMTAVVTQALSDVATKQDIADLRNEMDGKLDGFRNEMNGKFDDLHGEMNGRFDAVMDAVGERFDDHEQRITTLETTRAAA